MKLSIKQQIEQDRAYKAYQMALADEFANSEDGSYEISDEQAKELEHLHQDLQIMDVIITDDNQ